MTDAENDDLAFVVIAAVEDSVGASACAPDSFQLTAKSGANAVRVVKQRSGDELDDGYR